MLKEIFEQQKKFQELIHERTEFITPFEKIKACNIQIRRSIDELFESLKEMPCDLSGYSTCKKILSLNKDTTIDEVVDAFLFLVNSLNILDIDAEDFLQRCSTKQLINVRRFNNKQRFREQNDNFLIVIEGVDGVGKSSICKMLSHKLGYPVMKMPTVTGDIEHFSNFYRRTIANINSVMILDRFFPSSLVYGKFFNRTIRLEDLLPLTKQREIFIFIIDCDKPFRGDDFINEEQWPLIRELYLSHAKANKWTVIKNDSSLESCVQQIIAKLQF